MRVGGRGGREEGQAFLFENLSFCPTQLEMSEMGHKLLPTPRSADHFEGIYRTMIHKDLVLYLTLTYQT